MYDKLGSLRRPLVAKVDDWKETIFSDEAVNFLIAEAYVAADKSRSDDGLENRKRLNRLQFYFEAAIKIARKFGVRRGTVDKIIEGYIKRSMVTSRFTRSINLPRFSMILDLVKVGASREVVEKLIKHLSEDGSRGAVAELAKLMNRKLTKQEILSLATHYNNGAIRSDETDKWLIDLAKSHLASSEDKKFIEKLIDDRRIEFDSHID